MTYIVYRWCPSATLCAADIVYIINYIILKQDPRSRTKTSKTKNRHARIICWHYQFIIILRQTLYYYNKQVGAKSSRFGGENGGKTARANPEILYTRNGGGGGCASHDGTNIHIVLCCSREAATGASHLETVRLWEEEPARSPLLQCAARG